MPISDTMLSASGSNSMGCLEWEETENTHVRPHGGLDPGVPP